MRFRRRSAHPVTVESLERRILLSNAPISSSAILSPSALSVFVSSYNTGIIYRIDAATGATTTFASGLGNPEGLAIDQHGALYVGGEFAGIRRFDLASGTRLSNVGTNVDGPEGPSLDAAGNLFVNTRQSPASHTGVWEISGGYASTAVQVVPPFSDWGEGTAFLTSGPFAGSLLAADSQGASAGRIVRSAAPAFGSATDFITGLGTPFGIAVSPSGDVFVDDAPSGGHAGNSTPTDILSYDSRGNFKSVFASGLDAPGFLAFDPSGNLYVTETAVGTLLKFLPDGTKSVVATGIPQITGIALSSQAAPSVPTNVQASQSAHTEQVNVSWNPSSGAQSYELWRSLTDDSRTAVQIAANLLTTTYDDPGLTPGTAYYYWVKADNPFAISAFSDPGIVTIIRPDPTAHLADPASNSVTAFTILNARHYVDIQFSTFSVSGVNVASILDRAPEFTVAGSAGQHVRFTGTPQPQSGSIYRYHFSGAFGLGPISFNYIAASWSDGDGNLGVATTDTFTAASSDLKLTATRRGHQPVTVDIHRFGGGLIDPLATTWLVIHGRAESASSTDIVQLAAAVLADRPKDQVLTLDWQKGAAPAPGKVAFVTDFTGQDWIPFVGPSAGRALRAYGFVGQTLNIIGHSWGAYVGVNVAHQLGGVNTIVALDAARYVPVSGASSLNGVLHGGQYNTDTLSFQAESQMSWAFRSSFYGSPVTPATATYAIEANAGGFLSPSAHTNVVGLFASMLSVDARPPGDPACFWFGLSRLIRHAQEPWKANTFTDGNDPSLSYNAIIDSDSSDTALQDLKYIDAATEQLVLVT